MSIVNLDRHKEPTAKEQVSALRLNLERLHSQFESHLAWHTRKRKRKSDGTQTSTTAR